MGKQFCKNCGKEIDSNVPDAIYCSIECTYGLTRYKEDVASFP